MYISIPSKRKSYRIEIVKHLYFSYMAVRYDKISESLRKLPIIRYTRNLLELYDHLVEFYSIIRLMPRTVRSFIPLTFLLLKYTEKLLVV